MFSKAIIYSLITLSVTLTLGYLSRATNKDVVENQDGMYLLRMHKLYNTVGVLGLVFSAIFMLSPLIVHNPNWTFYLIVFFVFLSFGGLGLLSILYFRRHFVLFDDVKLEVSSPFGDTKSIFWNEVTKAKFSSFSGLLTLTTTTGEKVKIHYHLLGFPKFIEQLERKTTWTAKQLKVPM